MPSVELCGERSSKLKVLEFVRLEIVQDLNEKMQELTIDHSAALSSEDTGGPNIQGMVCQEECILRGHQW